MCRRKLLHLVVKIAKRLDGNELELVSAQLCTFAFNKIHAGSALKLVLTQGLKSSSFLGSILEPLRRK